MTPFEYVKTIVLPTWRETVRDPTDRRLAYLACTTVYHLCDYLALAHLSCSDGFTTASNRLRKKRHEDAVAVIQEAVAARCHAEFKVVGDICNGFKHPARMNRLPGTEREVPAFSFDIEGSGWDQGRWNGPGLAVDVDCRELFLDDCIMEVLRTFRALYPKDLTAPASPPDNTAETEGS